MIKKILVIVLSLIVSFCYVGCVAPPPSGALPPAPPGGESGVVAPDVEESDTETDFESNDDEMFTSRDLEDTYAPNSCIKVVLTGDSAQCGSDKVKISGNVVTITDAGDYLI